MRIVLKLEFVYGLFPDSWVVACDLLSLHKHGQVDTLIHHHRRKERKQPNLDLDRSQCGLSYNNNNNNGDDADVAPFSDQTRYLSPISPAFGSYLFDIRQPPPPSHTPWVRF